MQRQREERSRHVHQRWGTPSVRSLTAGRTAPATGRWTPSGVGLETARRPTRVKADDRYGGARPFKALYMSTATLYSTRSRTRSQCRLIIIVIIIIHIIGIIIHKTFIVRLLQTSCKNKMCLVLVKIIKVFSSFSYIFIVLLYYYHCGDWRIKMNVTISLI